MGGGEALVGEGEDGAEVLAGLSGVEMLAVDHEAAESLGLAELIEGGGELEFALEASVGGNLLAEDAEDVGGEDILAVDAEEGVVGESGDGEVLSGVVEGGLLGEFGDVEEGMLWVGPGAAGGAVVVDGRARGLIEREGGTRLGGVEGVEELSGAGAGFVGGVEVVAEEEEDGLSVGPVAGAVDGVSEALLFALLDVGDMSADVGEVGGLRLAVVLETGELGVGAGREVGGDEVAVGGSDDDGDVVAAGGERLLDDALEDGLADAVGGDHRQEFLLDGLGGGEHTGAESGGGDEGLAHGGSSYSLRYRGVWG